MRGESDDPLGLSKTFRTEPLLSTELHTVFLCVRVCYSSFMELRYVSRDEPWVGFFLMTWVGFFKFLYASIAAADQAIADGRHLERLHL